MKAILFTKYGSPDVLLLTEVEKPTPKDNQVLVKVHFAEYVCAGETKLALKPANVSFEAAATSPVVGFTALQGLRDKGQIRAGQKVLINGASGGVGVNIKVAKRAI